MWELLIFANLFALVIAGGVAGAVLPLRARRIRNTDVNTSEHVSPLPFPWFWVAFPLTCFSAATACSMTFYPPLTLTGTRRYADYLEPDPFTVANGLSAVFTVLAVVGLALSVWAWRARRF